MKIKIPLLNLWLVSEKRLHAGYQYRYDQGYMTGFQSGSDHNWDAYEAFNAAHPREERADETAAEGSVAHA